jgi:hypothetical protein
MGSERWRSTSAVWVTAFAIAAAINPEPAILAQSQPPPTVTITEPANGTTVSGTTKVSAPASSSAVGVFFKVDGLDLFGTFSFTTLDGTAPSVSVTGPTSGSSVSGTVTLTATASDNVGVAGVQFKVDGVNVGSEDLTSPYTSSWNTTSVTSGSHSLTAVARDAAGNRTTSGLVTVTVSNDTTAPVISAVAASSITSSSVTTAWTTNEASDSQVEYGLTTAYGSASTLNATRVTTHSMGLTGLAGATLYHYRVKSRDAAGNLAVSGDFTFTTTATADTVAPTVAVTAPVAGTTVVGTTTLTATAADNVGVAGVQLKLDGNDLRGEMTTAPYSFSWNTLGSSDLLFSVTKIAVGGVTIGAGTGFTKRLGVSCPSCTNEDTVTEDKVQATLGPVAGTFTFNASARYLAQLAAFRAVSSPSYVQGTTATTNTGTTSLAKAFTTPVSAGSLIVVALAWQTNVPVTLTDNQGNAYAVATSAYDAVNNQSLAIVYAANTRAGATTVTASFGAAAPSVQRLELHEYRGIALTNPLDATAANIADGTSVANAVTSGTTSTSVTLPVSNGTHTLTAQARDTSGNTATSAVVTITINNPAPDTTPPTISNVTATALTVSGATISWTTNEASDTQVEYGSTTSYGTLSTLNATSLTAHSTSLSGLASGTTYHYRVRSRDAAGNLATSGDFTFTTATAPNVSVNLAWEASPDLTVTGYKLYIGTSTGVYSTTVNVGNVTAYTVTGLTSGTVYYFVVTAFDATGLESDLSNEVSWSG